MTTLLLPKNDLWKKNSKTRLLGLFFLNPTTHSHTHLLPLFYSTPLINWGSMRQTCKTWNGKGDWMLVLLLNRNYLVPIWEILHISLFLWRCVSVDKVNQFSIVFRRYSTAFIHVSYCGTLSVSLAPCTSSAGRTSFLSLPIKIINKKWTVNFISLSNLSLSTV